MTENHEAPSPFDLAKEVYAAGRTWVTEQVASGEEFQLNSGAWEILADAPREALEAMAFAALRHKMVQRCGGKAPLGGEGVVDDEDRRSHPLAVNPAIWIEDEELGKTLVKKEEGLFVGWDHADNDAKMLAAGRRHKLGDGSHREASNIRDSIRLEP